MHCDDVALQMPVPLEHMQALKTAKNLDDLFVVPANVIVIRRLMPICFRALLATETASIGVSDKAVVFESFSTGKLFFANGANVRPCLIGEMLALVLVQL